MEESKITRAEPLPEANVEPTTTLLGINDKIMSWDYRGMHTEIMIVDSQESLAGQVLRRMFVQTFVLLPQKKRNYTYNNIFRFLDGGAKSNQQLALQVANNIASVHDLPSSTALDQGKGRWSTSSASRKE
ncbi:hypothetical protein L7F22_028220 [Adiantum nelumboides]|nr:hypothetical protein [Adiantum nelumboides]